MAQTDTSRIDTTTIVRTSNTDYQQSSLYQELKSYESISADWLSDVGLPSMCVLLLLVLAWKWVQMTYKQYLSYGEHERAKTMKIIELLDKLIDKLLGDKK